MIVVTRTPLRVSFFGGGTDLPDFYKRSHGAVISTAIDKYVYVTLKTHGELFDEPYRLNYSQTELVADIKDIQNEIGREALRLTGSQPPVYVATIADIPSGSGLGSSSAYAVGLLNALYAHRAMRITPGDLAEMACHIEIDVLAKPIGRQDQYSAAFGGMNYIKFLSDGSTSITPIGFGRNDLNKLFDHFQLFWTGVTRQSEAVLSEQKSRIDDHYSYLEDIRDIANEAHGLIMQGQMTARKFGELLDRSWRLKRQLASRVSNDRIDDWYERALKAGAYGGKLCGAGGGGFLLFVVPPAGRVSLCKALPELREIAFHYEPMGSTVLFPNGLQDNRSETLDGQDLLHRTRRRMSA